MDLEGKLLDLFRYNGLSNVELNRPVYLNFIKAYLVQSIILYVLFRLEGNLAQLSFQYNVNNIKIFIEVYLPI